MHLDKQRYKNQRQKIYLNAIIATALTMLYLHSNKPNAATFVHYRILKNSNKITVSSASLSTGTGLEPISLCI